MSFIRRKRVGKHVYFQRVHKYREDGKVKEKVLEHLGPNPPGDYRPLNPVEAKIVADEVAQREPTQEEVRRLLDSLEVETGNWDYRRLGIDIDLLKKTRHLRLK